jgi:DNA-binding CsgD family transcriptional regulator
MPAMIGVLRGERRHGNARLSDALLQLRANSVVVLEFHALWVRGAMAELEGNQSLAAKGLTNKEIASHLNLSARTIEMHVALALERLNCRTRSEGVSRAFSQGLLGIKD